MNQFKSRKEAVDEYQRVRTLRLETEKEAEALKEIEKTIEQWLLSNFTVGKVSGAFGTEWKCYVEPFRDWVIEDEKKLYEFIAKNRVYGAFSLLYRRLNQENADKWAKRTDLTKIGLATRTIDKLHHRART